MDLVNKSSASAPGIALHLTENKFWFSPAKQKVQCQTFYLDALATISMREMYNEK